MNTKLDELDRLLSLQINTLDLSPRAQISLTSVGYLLLGDIARTSRKQVQGSHRIGKKTLNEIDTKLAELKIPFGINIPLGPMEKQAVLNSSLVRYIPVCIFLRFRDAKISTVTELINLGPIRAMPLITSGGWHRYEAQKICQQIGDALLQRGIENKFIFVT